MPCHSCGGNSSMIDVSTAQDAVNAFVSPLLKPSTNRDTAFTTSACCARAGDAIATSVVASTIQNRFIGCSRWKDLRERFARGASADTSMRRSEVPYGCTKTIALFAPSATLSAVDPPPWRLAVDVRHAWEGPLRFVGKVTGKTFPRIERPEARLADQIGRAFLRVRTTGESTPFHEHPVRPVLVGDLAFWIRIDVDEPVPPVQGMGGAHEIGTVQPDSHVASTLGFREQTLEHRTSGSSSPMSGLDVHALDLGDVARESLQAADAARTSVADGEHDLTVWQLELVDPREIPFDGFADWKTKAVPRFHLVIPPREILEPEARHVVPIARKFGESHLDGVIVA